MTNKMNLSAGSKSTQDHKDGDFNSNHPLGSREKNAVTSTLRSSSSSFSSSIHPTPLLLANATNQIQEIRNVYLYGLQQVSILQDLQKAPDAILPGNILS